MLTKTPPYLKTAFETAGSPSEYLGSYLARVAELARAADPAALGAVVRVVEDAIVNDRAIYLMGNGGSSAAASHFVNDIGPNSLAGDAPGVRVFNLTDNVASVTSTANDTGYDQVFALQLRAYLRPGDVVIAMSVSGNSPNILEGAAVAHAMGCPVVAFTGFEGGQLAAACDIHVNFASTADEYGPVEDLFSIAGHAITGFITMRRGRWLHH
jgi:D-sedoheptulose 7-phosphate isomerase